MPLPIPAQPPKHHGPPTSLPPQCEWFNSILRAIASQQPRTSSPDEESDIRSNTDLVVHRARIPEPNWQTACIAPPSDFLSRLERGLQHAAQTYINTGECPWGEANDWIEQQIEDDIAVEEAGAPYMFDSDDDDGWYTIYSYSSGEETTGPGSVGSGDEYGYGYGYGYGADDEFDVTVYGDSDSGVGERCSGSGSSNDGDDWEDDSGEDGGSGSGSGRGSSDSNGSDKGNTDPARPLPYGVAPPNVPAHFSVIPTLENILPYDMAPPSAPAHFSVIPALESAIQHGSNHFGVPATIYPAHFSVIPALESAIQHGSNRFGVPATIYPARPALGARMVIEQDDLASSRDAEREPSAPYFSFAPTTRNTAGEQRRVQIVRSVQRVRSMRSVWALEPEHRIIIQEPVEEINNERRAGTPDEECESTANTDSEWWNDFSDGYCSSDGSDMNLDDEMPGDDDADTEMEWV